MTTWPTGRHGLHFLLFLAVTGTALLERFSQVAAPRLGLPHGLLLGGLGLAYVAYLALLPGVLERLREHLDATSPDRWFLAAWGVLAVLFALVYPLIDSGALGFASDREEALDVAVRALWRGDFPYTCRAVSGIHHGCPESGNLIAPMPGGLLLAMPAVLLFGGAGWLSLLSLGVAYLGLAAYWRNRRHALLHLVILLAAAPILSAELLSGGDHIANAVFTGIPLLLLLQDPQRRHAPWLALLFGCALSWRGLFWLLVVPVIVHFARHGRWRELLVSGGFTLAGFALVTLPVLLWNPAGFSPWAVQQRYDLYAHIVPHASAIVPAATIALGAWLGWRARDGDDLLLACGWTLLLPILAGALLNSLDLGRPSLVFYGWYGITTLLFFSVPALRAHLDRRRHRPAC